MGGRCRGRGDGPLGSARLLRRGAAVGSARGVPLPAPACAPGTGTEGTGLARWGGRGIRRGPGRRNEAEHHPVPVAGRLRAPWLRPGPAAGRYLRQLLAALVGFACVVGPVTWRNAAVGGELVLVSANGGVNFYIGNNAAADSTVAIHPGMHWERLMAEPVEAGYESPGERSAYFMRRAFADISSDFPGWAGRLAEKAWLLLSGPEVKRNQDPYYAAGHSRLLSLLLWDEAISFPHGVVLPLALLGLAVTWRQRNPALDLLRLFLAGYGLSIVLFFVTSRYRTPLTPAWLPFAAAGARLDRLPCTGPELAAGRGGDRRGPGGRHRPQPAGRAPHLGGRPAAPRPRRGHAAQGALARVAGLLPAGRGAGAGLRLRLSQHGGRLARPPAPAAGREGEPPRPGALPGPAPPPGFSTPAPCGRREPAIPRSCSWARPCAPPPGSWKPATSSAAGCSVSDALRRRFRTSKRHPGSTPIPGRPPTTLVAPCTPRAAPARR